ncbi:hypothetical protein RRG08_008483 [Elysia crispata]|uniref:Uncharacterized protein n=1 Tax=Elysia crispata TaxID=231223 RepID=A0AAE0Z861_9GAST|nr:hypothetical protein RRG08_008483 [Elysia crispata]
MQVVSVPTLEEPGFDTSTSEMSKLPPEEDIPPERVSHPFAAAVENRVMYPFCTGGHNPGLQRERTVYTRRDRNKQGHRGLWTSPDVSRHDARIRHYDLFPCPVPVLSQDV